MTDAVYRNYGHYISEGWSREPKETFKWLADIIEAEFSIGRSAVLDVGCATGELLGFLSSRKLFERYVGVDVTTDLLDPARAALPQAEFVQASALDLPAEFDGRFDLVAAMGCMSIFDESQIDRFWANLFRVVKTPGLIVVLAPLNEFDVDVMIRHRKYDADGPRAWETGWNIHSERGIRAIVERHGAVLETRRFQIPFDLPRREDLARTWTMRTEHRERQTTNGLKLLIDHYFMIVRCR